VQANQHVYRLGAVGRLLLTDYCPRCHITVAKTRKRGDPSSQTPENGEMEVQMPNGEIREKRHMIDRRTILLAFAATTLPSLWTPGRSQSVPTRYNVVSPQGKAMLRIYADAVKAMKALSGQNGRSWIFQWYIHATPIDKAQAISNVFGTTTGPARDLAGEAWYTCQPHMTGQPGDYFLPWHRLYVIYLEQIVRSITGRQDFTLPYWDYTTPASYAIPFEFQTQFRNDPVFSTLFMENRNKDGGRLKSAYVNAGEPLNKHYTGTDNFLVLPDLTQPRYSSFCAQLNSNLHGSIHVFTGDTTNMGNVPTAAGDPVFWLHHCNIDRIWAAWNAAGGQNPTQTNGIGWANTKFVYANDSGARVQVAISTVANPSALPYRYDTLPRAATAVEVAGGTPSANMVLLRSIAPGLVTTAAATTAAAVPLGASPQTVRLAPTGTENRLTAVAPQIQAGGPSRLILTLNGVQAQQDPSTVFRVYLDLPANASPQVADQHYVGLLNFFGATMDAGHGMQGGTTAEFDVTGVVARLNAQNSLQNETSVTLVPVGSPADGSAPVISGGIELQRQ
jgi:tyrosinase